jgi:stringent starvation protein B
MHEITNERLRFSARFRGSPFDVSVPVAAVLAIYARENGQGIFFKDAEAQTASDPDSAEKEPRNKPHLTLVK